MGYPPSNRTFQSRMLVEALTSGGRPYWQPREGDVDWNMNLINKIWPDDPVMYRNNREMPDPAARNQWSVDLWCRDARMQDAGCNNWE